MRTAEHTMLPELLKAVAAGELEAFRELYDRYIQQVYAYSYFLTRSNEQSEDLSQELFTKIWTKRNELARLDNFDAWLTTLVRNQAYNYLRKNALEQRHLKQLYQQQPTSESTGTEAVVIGKEYAKLYEEAIENLPPQQKKVFLLSRKEGLKHEEIASNMGISLNTVKNHMKAALFSIRTHLKAYLSTLIILVAMYFLIG